MKSMNKQPQLDPVQVHFERRHPTSLWGRKYFITPRVVEKVLGDGRQLIGLEPLNTRPNYYVVRVDSSWNISNWGEGPLLCDHIDEILEAIEDQFGRAWYDGDPPQRKSGRSFPALSDDNGFSWFSLNWPAGLERPVNAAQVPAELVEGPTP